MNNLNFEKKNYTIGSKTLFNEIQKIPPASKTLFINNNISMIFILTQII